MRGDYVVAGDRAGRARRRRRDTRFSALLHRRAYTLTALLSGSASTSVKKRGEIKKKSAPRCDGRPAPLLAVAAPVPSAQMQISGLPRCKSAARSSFPWGTGDTAAQPGCVRLSLQRARLFAALKPGVA
ncbi:hypothetical protein MRX96_040368 [Rhipicephalus microplus]